MLGVLASDLILGTCFDYFSVLLPLKYRAALLISHFHVLSGTF